MLIINADDFGRTRTATDAILHCYGQKSITSASAMVYMADSVRAFESALETNLELGLHVNFTTPFDDTSVHDRLKAGQLALCDYFNRSRWIRYIYNPLLKKQIEYVFSAQYQEFVHLYNRAPVFINGHRHIHLCMNMIIDMALPLGSWVRGSRTPEPGESAMLTRVYKKAIDRRLRSRYQSVDMFFNIEPVDDLARHKRIVKIAKHQDVELGAHPEYEKQRNYIVSPEYQEIISSVRTGNYFTLIQSRYGNRHPK